MDRIGNLEEIIRSLKETKKKDTEIIDTLSKNYETQKNENFTLLVENKKLKNQISDMMDQNQTITKWFLDRREQANNFIETFKAYERTFEVINQVEIDLEKSKLNKLILTWQLSIHLKPKMLN